MMLLIMGMYVSTRPRQLFRMLMYNDRAFWRSESEECYSVTVLATMIKARSM